MKLDHPTLAYQNETRKRITVLRSMSLLIDTSVDEMANTISITTTQCVTRKLLLGVRVKVDMLS